MIDELPPNLPGFTTLRTQSSTDQEADAYSSDTDGAKKLNVSVGDKNEHNITAPPSRRPSLSTIVGSPNMDHIVVIDDADIEYNDCPDPMMVFSTAVEKRTDIQSELDHGDYRIQTVKKLDLSNIESEIDANGIVASLENELSVLESENA